MSGQDSDLLNDVDCRLLFMGTNYGRLLRAYPTLVRLLESSRSRAEVLESLADLPEVGALYETEPSDNGVRMRLREEVFSRMGPRDALGVELRISTGRGSERVATFVGSLEAVGAVLGLLTGTRSEAGVLAELDILPQPQATSARAFWSRLEGIGVIAESHPHGADVVASAAVPSVRFLGHTSLLFRSRQATVLTDPIVLPGKSSLSAGSLLRLKPDAVVLSHSHWDHCNLQTLALLDRRTTVVVPCVRRPTAFNPPMVPALAALGFRDIREAEIWSPVRISDIEIVPVPFFGEQDEPGAEIDHFTYVLRTEDLCVYGGVDAYRDSFGDMDPVLDEVRDRWRPQLAFLPVSRMIYQYRHGGVNGFCRAIEPRLLGEEFQYTASPEDAARWAARLGVRWAVPYAAFCIGRWEAFPEFRGIARAFERADMARTLLPLRPLDSITARELDGGARLAARRALAMAFYTSSAVTATVRLSKRVRGRIARLRRA